MPCNKTLYLPASGLRELSIRTHKTQFSLCISLGKFEYAVRYMLRWGLFVLFYFIFSFCLFLFPQCHHLLLSIPRPNFGQQVKMWNCVVKRNQPLLVWLINGKILCLIWFTGDPMIFVIKIQNKDAARWPWPRIHEHGNTVELRWLEHWWLAYHGCFEHVNESPGNTPITADIIMFGIN